MAKANNPKGGRPKWTTPEQLVQIKEWLDEGQSRGEIGRRFGKQASQITLIIQREGWEIAPPQKDETKKVCTRCNEDKPIEEFPYRTEPDRKGKRHAMCEDCRHQWQIETKRRDYYQENKGKKRAAKRRALKHELASKDQILTDEYIDILENDICSYCGCIEENMQIDHIVPIDPPEGQEQGDHHWTNLTRSCKKCNVKKINKSLLHFLLAENK